MVVEGGLKGSGQVAEGEGKERVPARRGLGLGVFLLPDLRGEIRGLLGEELGEALGKLLGGGELRLEGATVQLG